MSPFSLLSGPMITHHSFVSECSLCRPPFATIRRRRVVSVELKSCCLSFKLISGYLIFVSFFHSNEIFLTKRLSPSFVLENR